MKKQLVRFDFWLNPVFDQTIATDPTVQMQVCDFAAADAVNWAHMHQAHAYHICAARDEVPTQWQVDEAFCSAHQTYSACRALVRDTTPLMFRPVTIMAS